MNKFLFLLVSFILCFSFKTYAKDVKDVKYEIFSAGSAAQGTCLVKVWVHSRSGKVTEEEFKYAAVHGVLFRGLAGQQGMPSQSPIINDVTVQSSKSDYFDAFFGKEEAYLNFASVVAGTYERIKKSKKGYKVSAVVQVSKDNLRKEMEKSGIIRGLSNGF